jgi:DNA repair exonuclease SbcCD ATPase subunit
MRIDLVSTEISGLSVFDVDQKVVFPQNQVCSITAENLDDGGSNASGKTSFVNSIPVNLYGPKAIGITAEDLKNRHLSVPARVVNFYKVDDILLGIDRTIGGKLKIKVGDAPWKEGKVDDIQKEINDIIKVTPDQLMMMSHKAQEDTTNFLLMKDSDKKDFLGSFFSLEDYEKAKDSADLEYKTAITTMNSIDGKIAVFVSNIETATKELIDSEKSVELLKSHENLEKMAGLKSQIETLTTAIDGLSYVVTSAPLIRESQDYKAAQKKFDTVIASTNSDVERHIASKTELYHKKNALSQEISSATVVIPEDLTRSLQDVEQAQVNMRAIIDKDSELSRNIMYVTAELKKKEAQFEFSKKSPTCVTCGQELKGHDPLKYSTPLQQEISEKQAEIASLNAQRNALSVPTSADIESLKNFQKELVGRIAQIRAAASKENLKAELRVVDGQISSVDRELEITTEKSKDAVRELARAEQDIIIGLKGQIALRQSERDRVNSDINAMKVQLDAADANVQKSKDKLAAVVGSKEDMTLVKAAQQRVIQELEIGAYILSKSGFIGYIFDGILEDLNKEINNTLKNIPCVRQYSLQFTPDKTVKGTGAVNKNITFILKDDMGSKNWKPMSGGEKLGIYVAVDESLNTVLSRRLGIHIGWKFLDEQFSMIDSNSKEAILEFYKMKAHNKTFFIVDHASEFNAALESQIKIVKKDKIARISCGAE